MFQRRPRRFRRRPNGRGHSSPENSYMQARQRSNSFSNSQTRNNFRHTESAERLLEKYNTLAKEAMSLGDKTLSENYLQHVDHFTRVIEDKSKNKDQSNSNANVINKTTVDDKRSSENSEIKQEDVTKNQE